MASVFRRCDGADIVYDSDGVTPPSFYAVVIIRTAKAISLQKQITGLDKKLERSYIAKLPTRIGTIHEQELVLFYPFRTYKFAIAELREHASQYNKHVKAILGQDTSMKIRFDMEDMISCSKKLCWEFYFK